MILKGNSDYSGIAFPNAKINLGLRILNRRSDGFHAIETILYPIPLFDVMEWKPAKKFSITSHGISIPFNGQKNLVEKAYEALRKRFAIPPLQVHLLKNIPPGSGLGGGSSDAVFFLKALKTQQQPPRLTNRELKEIALNTGSDCPFFIHNRPAIATGRGEMLKACPPFLKGYWLFLVFEGTPVNTRDAYQQVVPSKKRISIEEIINLPPEEWKDKVQNDFEPAIFKNTPQLKSIRDKLYKHGALYAAMTGSGSAIYSIFNNAQSLPAAKQFNDCLTWKIEL